MPVKSVLQTIMTILLGNMTAKLMALAMAVALWLSAFYFSYTQPPPYHVPLKVLTDQGWSVLQKGHLFVDVELKYPSAD